MFIPLAALLMIISNIETVARTTEKMATEVIETVDLKIEQIEQIEQIVQDADTAGTIFEVVEKMPEFPGGMQKLMEYISKNVKYPAEAKTTDKQGRVIVQMIIDENGKITNPKVLQSLDPLLDAEAIRLISSMPNWKPGMEKGKAVKVKYTIPVVFRLQ